MFEEDAFVDEEPASHVSVGMSLDGGSWMDESTSDEAARRPAEDSGDDTGE